jgi:hypothetical protein
LPFQEASPAAGGKTLKAAIPEGAGTFHAAQKQGSFRKHFNRYSRSRPGARKSALRESKVSWTGDSKPARRGIHRIWSLVVAARRLLKSPYLEELAGGRDGTLPAAALAHTEWAWLFS